MPRIRTIKPEFPQSESMGRVSRDARLLFVLLWTICDDAGRTRAASRMLASLLYPYDDDAPKRIDGWMAELEREGCVVRYQHEGATYLEVCNWLSHQKIDRPSASKIPPPDESSRILANPREPSSGDRDLDQGPRTKEGTKEAREQARDPDGLDPQAWGEWVAYRKSTGKAIKPASVAAAKKSLAAHGADQMAVVQQSIANGWQGLFELKQPRAGSRPLTKYEQSMKALEEWGTHDTGSDQTPVAIAGPNVRAAVG